MAEPIASTFAAPVVENSVNAIGRQFGYLWNYKKNMASLEKQVKTLENKISDMDHRVIEEEKNAMKIGAEAKGWLSEAKEINAREKKFLEEHAEKREKKCLVGLCPNLISRHQFSRSACKKEKDVLEAITKACRISKVSFRPVGQESAVLSIEGCFTFDSRKSVMEDIMKALKDETKKSMLGVYGLGGMGKTTLAKQVASKAREEKLFEEVVFASVTQNVDKIEIQGQLASMLDLNLVESTVAERANRVHQRLKGKKVLVILDDLWVKLDLNEVGVSLGCKILLTSMYKAVLTSMGTEEDFYVGELGKDDAWRLFEEKTYKVVKNPDFHNIGKEIVQKCQGWPVLIVTIAASLSKRPQLAAWNDALNQLKNMNSTNLLHIVNSVIKSVIYNHLDETHKHLFLLCGATSGVASVEELLQYGWGLDLFEEEAMTIQEARDRLHILILDLKDSCLLLDDVDSTNSIKMHDVVRDVAISIGKKDLNMFSMGAELKTWPKDDDLKKCTAMVLRGCPDLSSIPLLLECPSLELFVMSGSSLPIPETFFEKTSKLKVLRMSNFHFTSLPKSLSFLTCLQTLRLDGCRSLKDVCVVGELKTLETLSFVNSGIEELPSEIGQLVELRLLDMRGCSRLKVIPAGLIQGLSRLQELYVDHDFNRWEADVCVNDSVKTNGSLRELEHLPNLYNLRVRVGAIKLLPESLNFENLKRYEIIVGDMWGKYGWWWIKELQVTTTICVQLSTTSINQLNHGVKKLVKRTQCLCLGELKDIQNVVPALDGDGFPNLKYLHIIKDDDIQYVVNVKDTRHSVVFPSLESLQLIELMKLHKLCNGPLMESSFRNLTTLKVESCDGLKSLFSFSMATKLPKLQKIYVSLCGVLEEIVAEKNINDNGVCENIEFVQLREISLKGLPKLHNFFNSGETQSKSQKCLRRNDSECQQIHAEEEEEFISSLPFFKKVSLPKLQELTIRELSHLTHMWSHRELESYCNLTILEIYECGNLKYLMTPLVAMSLVCLQNLTVKNCASMKHVVAKEGDTNTMTITFPLLSSLHLEDLDNLTTFYSSDKLNSVTQPLFSEKVSFPKLQILTLMELSHLKEIWSHKEPESYCNLKRLTVSNCANMKHVVAKEEGDTNTVATITFPQLQELVMCEIFNMTEIWSHSVSNSYCNLTKLEIYKCDNLKYLLTLSVATCLVGLQSLSVESCRRMKHVVAKEEGDTNTVATITFPQLNYLCLKNLDQLTTFCSSDNLDSVTQHLFNEKVSFPKLQELYLNKISNLTEIWTHTISYSCCNLTTLEIYKCDNLKYVLTPSVTLALEGLQRLSVRNCARMKHIVAKDTNTMTITFPQLSSLILEDLDDLTTFYSELLCEEMENSDTTTQPLFNEKVSFPKLDYLNLDKISHLNVIWNHKLQVPPYPDLIRLRIYQCKSLKHVFPYSMVPFLNKLEHLTVEDCEVLETIIGDDKSVGETATFLFPKLREVTLKRLPKAEYFYPKEHTIQCPELKVLNLGKCGKLSAFDFITFPEKQGDSEFEKVMPDLTNISIRSSDLMKIMGLYDHNLPPHLFRSLEYLQISEFHGESVVFRSKFLNIIHNKLQSFKVFNCFFQEIFPFEREDIHDDILFPQLRTLTLQKLSELKFIYKQDQCSPFILNVLERLETVNVKECPRLTCLVPSSVFFRSLTELIVKDCGGLTNLIQPSTARSLGHLMFLEISGCNMMETVIGEGGEESSQDGGEEFIFTDLAHLELEKLPKLTNFYSSSYHAFNFPELEYVRVKECPNMKTFCGGITTTPWLYNIDYEDEGRWEGDLNTTIKEANALSSENSSEKLIDSMTEGESCPKPEKESKVSKNSTESRKGTETCEEVVEEGKEGDICVNATAPEKGKGKEVEVSEQFTKHSDPSSKLSNHSEASTSSNNQSDQDAEKAVEPRKQPQLINHVVDELGNKNTYCDNAIEPRKANMEDSAKAQECHSDATNAEKTADTFGEGSMASQHVVASSSVTNPPTQTSLSLFPELEAKRLPSTSLNNHVEANALFSDNSSEELIYQTTEVQSCPKESEVPENSIDSKRGTETCDDVVEEGKEGDICVKASAPHNPDKGKGNEVEVSDQFTDHSDPSSKLSNHSQASTSSNNQFDQHAEKAAENCEEIVERGRKQVDICAQHVVPSSSRSSSPVSSSNNNSEVEAQLHYKSAEKVSDEPITESQICENSTEMSANMEVHKLASTGHFEAAAQLPEDSAKAEKTADTFEEGCIVSRHVVASSSCLSPPVTNLPAQTTLTLFPELEDHKSIPIVPSTSSTALDAEDTIQMSKFIQILQTQRVSKFSAEQVQFAENTIGLFSTYVDKAKQCLKRENEISELKRRIQALEQENEAVESNAPRLV